jgi:hypothetical protein
MITPKKTTIWLTALSIVVFSLCWKVYQDNRKHRVLCAFVQDLTTHAEVVEQYREGGLNGATPAVTAKCLKHAVEFQIPEWSSGSVDQPESVGSKLFATAPQSTRHYVTQLQRMVARERTAAIRDLIAHLRTTTGQNLGDDPQKWINEFANKKYPRPRTKPVEL